MFNICPNCGEYRVDKIVTAKTSVAACPVCGNEHKFLMLPLFVVVGASGTGKSSAALAMAANQTNVVVLEADILWRAEFDQPENDYREFREMCLRLCKNISQAGKPVALFGSGIPKHFAQCTESRYFSSINYLAIVCDEAVLEHRLRTRPKWRGSGTDDFVDRSIEYNRWLRLNAASNQPSIEIFDTTEAPVTETANAISKWIKEII